jgi:hypothetical protein
MIGKNIHQQTLTQKPRNGMSASLVLNLKRASLGYEWNQYDATVSPLLWIIGRESFHWVCCRVCLMVDF